MGLISKYSNGIGLLLCAVNIFNKYIWVSSLKNKIVVIITNVSQTFFNESGDKPNNRWVGKGSEFYYRSMKSCLQDNNSEIYSTYNGGKSLTAERFIKTWMNKIFKYMTLIPKIYNIDKLDIAYQ